MADLELAVRALVMRGCKNDSEKYNRRLQQMLHISDSFQAVCVRRKAVTESVSQRFPKMFGEARSTLHATVHHEYDVSNERVCVAPNIGQSLDRDANASGQLLETQSTTSSVTRDFGQVPLGPLRPLATQDRSSSYESSP